MKSFKNAIIPKEYKGSVIAVGNFDGMHKGHQKIFRQALKCAKKNKIKFGVLTFTPLPMMFFNQNIKNCKLVSENKKFQLFEKYGVDFVINIKFNKKFSNIKAEEFIKKIICKKINAQLLAVSNNFKFGKNRKGDVSLLKKFSNQEDYFLLKIKPFNYLGKIVSSTKIRNLLKKGDITLVNKLLSRTWSIEGKVIVGNKIGRKLGYRTCNIDVKNYILPRLGIYVVKISIENKKNIYGGVAYLGSRPTFGGKDIFLEINIFGIKQNLYKKNLKIYFLKFLRKDKKFMNSSQLMRQMNKDVIFAKRSLKAKLVL